MADLHPDKQAFIADNALVLYFDNALTPFVARFDLDSLAQANFEVTDKKDGLYTLTLCDFSGESQKIGQFANKTEAHQALYAILQALLSHNDQKSAASPSSKKSGVGCWLLRLTKWFLLLLGCIVLLYYILSLIPAPVTPTATTQTPPSVSEKAAAPKADNALSQLPAGEAVDADSILSPQTTPDSTTPTE